MELSDQKCNIWKNFIKNEYKKEYFQNIRKQIKKDRKTGITIFPKNNNFFNAFKKTDFNNIKVVIIGQDPYHQPGQAMGLSFSVPEGIKIPPSLRNIYKELGIKSNNGDLTNWAKEGVFLLNSILTVQSGKPASHSKIGWETFTDNVIQYISNNQENIVFLLWGAYAQSKKKFINQNKHFIIETSHPSPLSAYRGFLGSDCFNKCNEILKKNGINKVNWLK